MKKEIMLLLIVGILLTTALSVVEDVYKPDAHDRIDFSDDGGSGDCIDGGSTSNSGGGSGGGTSPGLKVLHLLTTSVSLPNTHIPIQ